MYFYQIKCCFVIRIYSVTGRRYVMKKVDELTKNRREMDRENISGHMPQALVSGNFFLPRYHMPQAYI